jgi:hypothetical protein
VQILASTKQACARSIATATACDINRGRRRSSASETSERANIYSPPGAQSYWPKIWSCDWITARVNQVETRVPWTLRIHDIGDFYSAEYVAAWRITVQQRPQCRFWFYTRSFADETIFEVLTSLASEPNCKGWLSIDSENYERGMLAYCKEPKAWGVSLLQEEPSVLPPDMVPAILSNVADGQLVNFPKHHGGRHVPVASSALPSCPQVMGAFLLQTNAALSRPCQSCALCLPSAISI